jgi:hypothetical protein
MLQSQTGAQEFEFELIGQERESSIVWIARLAVVLIVVLVIWLRRKKKEIGRYFPAEMIRPGAERFSFVVPPSGGMVIGLSLAFTPPFRLKAAQRRTLIPLPLSFVVPPSGGMVIGLSLAFTPPFRLKAV